MNYMTRGLGTLVAVVALIGISGCGDDTTSPPAATTTTAVPASLAADKVTQLDIDGGDFFFDLNGTTSVPAGSVDVNFTNTGTMEDHIVMFLLPKPGHTYDEVVEAANTDFTGLKAQPLADFYGGVNAVHPGESQTSRLNLDPGEYVVGCFIPSQTDLKPHSVKGMVTKLVVTPPTDGEVKFVEPPNVKGTLDQTDFAFTIPKDFDGKGTWKVSNSGAQLHETGIAKLDDGKTAADVSAFFAGIPIPPAPFIGAGGFGANSPGKDGYITLDLAPGNYVFVCLVGDPTNNKLHIAEGMVDSFSVT